MSDSSPCKTLRLVDYLLAIAKINASIIRTLDEYRKVLWVSDVPKELKYCYSRVWGESEEHGDDVWLEVKKYSEPPLPAIPQTCKDWVDLQSVRNTQSIPELRSQISIEKRQEDPQTGEIVIGYETSILEDFPGVQKAWDEYLESKWLPWSELYNRYSAVQRVYAELFFIFQEMQKLGEQYELIFCFGLLTWRTPSHQPARRHLITAKAALEFEPHLGKFTIRPAMDGEQVTVELDMLDIQDQPSNARQLVDDGREWLQFNLWNRANVDAVLASVAHSLADQGQGEYLAENLEYSQISPSDKPIVEYAPALILRKRSTRGLEEMLKEIRRQITSGIEAPAGFLDLSESLPESQQGEHGETEEKGHQWDGEVYFPLAANKEQRRIIETLARQRGVLVQGPPGTGKSHTIANLICHLLASDKRILITAKTPRALQVLYEKLPKDVRPLCINLLGSSADERESLERSVLGILSRLDQRNEAGTKDLISVLEGRIRNNRKALAETDAKLLSIRERETYTHIVAGGAYTGTAAQIARKLNEEDKLYPWFADKISHDDHLPLMDEEVACLCRVMAEIDQDAERQSVLFIPNPESDLVSDEQLHIAFSEEKRLQATISAHTENIVAPDCQAFLAAGKDDIKKVCEIVSRLAAETESVRKRPGDWLERAIVDVLTDRDTPWKELERLSSQTLEEISELASKVDALEVTIPPVMDRKRIFHDAKALKNHFDTGGGKGFLFIKPKPIRQHGTLMGQVKVDGVECMSGESLGKLIDYLTVQQKLDYIWSLWSGKAERRENSFPLQIAEIMELHESLGRILALYPLMEDAGACIASIPGLTHPRWEDPSSIHHFCETCRAVLAKLGLDALQAKLEKLELKISAMSARSDAHPIVQKLLQAFRVRDCEGYMVLLHNIRELIKKADAVNAKRRAIAKLAEYAPHLAASISENVEPDAWIARLRNLRNVWTWAQAKDWLEKHSQLDGESLERHFKRLEEEIRLDLGELAAVKAWHCCFSRMKDDHRRNLMAWQQEMKAYGKGTGKHAHTHRMHAQRHMNECRDAVPAWVMPLHRVYDTVQAGAGIFDVIIVDEASQCGPEALPLLYLGKNILVVGDDKQISPEAVGVNRGQIQMLMQNHLQGFQFANTFDVDRSLFDHARIRFSNRITLREHFRCMPEIIRFSNDFCYQSQLIPLRQYPPDRLEPLKVVHVREGYREGVSSRVINRPEAEALVDAIAQCCEDERYEGMTMGVIVLQGDSQADIIESLLLNRIGAEEMEKRRLISGDAYSFQGDERDVIFLSLVAAPNERIGVLSQEPDRRRFNVAASRARDQMWLFHSATSNHLSHACFRRRLVDYFYYPPPPPLGGLHPEIRETAHKANRVIERPPAPFDSWFEVDVALVILGRGYDVVPQIEIAGKRIDLMVRGSKTQLAVECDGDAWHGADQYYADVERQRMLERCDLHFVRIRESLYYATPEKALEPLWQELDRMGICPVTVNGVEVDICASQAILTDEIEESETLEQEEEAAGEVEDEEDVVDHEEFALTPDDMLDMGKEHPHTIQEALRVKPDILSQTIIDVLKERPNNSCVRDNMSTYILRRWNIRTKGKPRESFARKVKERITVMSRQGYVVIYKSKNIRIKLGWKQYKGFE